MFQEYPELIKTVIVLLVLLVIAIKSDTIIKTLKFRISQKQLIVIIFAVYLILDIILF